MKKFKLPRTGKTIPKEEMVEPALPESKMVYKTREIKTVIGAGIDKQIKEKRKKTNPETNQYI